MPDSLVECLNVKGFNPASVVKTELPEIQTKLCYGPDVLGFVLDNVLTLKECTSLVKFTESKGYIAAVVGGDGPGEGFLAPDYRRGSRCIVDDTDFCSEMYRRLLPHVPQKFQDCTLAGVNERLRFLRYKQGDFFKRHTDAQYARPGGLQFSLITLQFYLTGNGHPSGDSNEDWFTGGETRFFGSGQQLDVNPCPGRVLVFQQDELRHEGSLVTDGPGAKYTFRTELMYTPGKAHKRY